MSGSGWNICVIVVKFAFLYSSSFLYQLIIVKFAFVQGSCMVREDKSVQWSFHFFDVDVLFIYSFELAIMLVFLFFFTFTIFAHLKTPLAFFLFLFLYISLKWSLYFIYSLLVLDFKATCKNCLFWHSKMHFTYLFPSIVSSSILLL